MDSSMNSNTNSGSAVQARKSRLAVPTGDALHTKKPHSSSNTNKPNSLYLQRLFDFKQMDIQSALDQMRTLLSTRPQSVYKTAYYRKQTKNHWSRDDPAFCVLQFVFLVLASIAYSVAFRIKLSDATSFLLCSVLWNWLGLGILMASLGREISNRHLISTQTSSHVKQQVEWLYAFDIHCNSFFPVFVVLYGLQLFALPIALSESFVGLLVSNTLYAGAFCWYWYITHLGYRSLPFLSGTQVFLFPIVAILGAYVGLFIAYPFGFGWNVARVMARFYFV